MCNQREAGASPPSLPEIFFHVQPARGGGKPSFLTWNLLPCATGARRGQAHLPYLESSSMCNRREAGQALLPYLESSSMCNRREAEASPPPYLESSSMCTDARRGQALLLTWNLLRFLSSALCFNVQRGQTILIVSSALGSGAVLIIIAQSPECSRVKRIASI